MKYFQRPHCSPPGAAMDGKVVVEDEAGELADFTTVSWRLGLGETLCYRFRQSGDLSLAQIHPDTEL